jgi:hypothetical protein
VQFKSFTQYVTEETKSITVAWGRYNPPTIGHEKLMKTVAKIGKGGTFRIYASQTYQNQKDKEGYYKDPLPYKDKIKIMRKMFPKYARNIMYTPKIRTMFDLMSTLYKEGFTNVTIVAGSDRVTEYEVTLNRYNNKKGKHGFYNFDGGVNAVSAGQRDPDGEGASGMSASKLRAAAADNDFQAFSNGMPKGIKDAQKLFNDVRKGMGLKESYDYRSHIQLEPVSEKREEYVNGELYKEGDLVVVKENDQIGTILFCGSNYVLVEMNGGKYRKWINDIERLPDAMQVEGKEDPDIGDRKGSQPAIYHKGLKKSTKQKRDAQFRKQAKMDDDDPSAYKPAPGDKEAKTKPSKHTKKFKQMYGEQQVDRAKDKIEREKKRDAVKHDRMLDRARIRDTLKKNRETNAKS